jgi:hypothetical protein
MHDGSVTFRTKTGKTITLDALRFLHRLLQHVLPARFVKIRHSGLLAPGKHSAKLARARDVLQVDPAAALAPLPETTVTTAPDDRPLDWRRLLHRLTGIDVARCPRCGARARIRRPLANATARSPPPS